MTYDLHQSPRRPAGRLDNEVDFFVTSFELRPNDIHLLPNWIRRRVPRDSYNFKKSTRNSTKKRNARRVLSRLSEIPGTPRRFLGLRRNPANRCAATGLATGLLVRGYAPLFVRFYLKRKRFGTPLYRLNIFWKRRGTDDRTLLNELIDRNRALFDQLQILTWNIFGIEFSNHRSLSIVFDFRKARLVAPSMRRGELGLYGDSFRFFPPVTYNQSTEPVKVAAE